MSEMRFGVLCCFVIGVSGCAHQAGSIPTPGANAPLLLMENPLLVPVTNRDFLWSQVVDTIDDYFQIEREERVRLVGDILTAGRIDTVPQGGATMLEPWRKDSSPGFERLLSTLQSVRRRAVVQVSPAEGGYQIGVSVFRELEDVDRPQSSTVGGQTLRHDGSLIRQKDRIGDGPVTLGWIPQGRDIALEQRILADLHGRLGQGGLPPGQ